MTRLMSIIFGGLLLLGITSCGDDADSNSSTSTTATTTAAVPGEPDTTSPDAPATTGGKSCLSIANEAIQLAQDFRNESRGIAGPPDEAAFRASAEALRAEAVALGCPIPAVVNQFLDG